MRIPILGALIANLVAITRPFELAATTIAAAGERSGPRVAHEDPDPCAYW